MNLVLGSNGLLGKTLSATLEKEKTIFLDRAELVDWDASNISISQAKFFSEYGKRLSRIFVAVGETNSQASSDQLLKANFSLPRNLLEIGKDYGFRVITFGTIHEESPIDSPYVVSKKMYRDHVIGCQPESFLHFQLHTLYSLERAHAHSFLGQIINSLRRETVFNMSSGRQLREFHNVNRDAESIINIAFSTKIAHSIHPLSHGNITKLSDLAQTVFASLSKLDLLKIGSLPDPINEVYDLDFFSKFPVTQSVGVSVVDEIVDTIKRNLL